MKWLSLLVSSLQAASTWLHFHTTEFKPFWKLTIVVVEFGHYLGVMSFVIFLLALVKIRKNWRSYWSLSAILSLYASAIFFLPSIRLATNFPRWQSQLEAAFGKIDNQQPAALSLKKLYLGEDAAVKAETLEFAEKSGENLFLDFYHAKSKETAPWVLVIHGGGWNSGERTQLAELNSILAEGGIAVATIDYRLAPKSQWPAQKEDVESAVNFLKSHATQLGIDPTRWVILGRSAGGQIAESFAYASNDTSLKGCISFYAPSDMNFAYRFAREDDILRSRSLIRDYLGGDPVQARANFDATSTLNFVRPGIVPTLLLHGPLDSLVWVKHSERLIAKLQAAKVPSAYIEIPWATHGFDYNITGPSGQLSTFAIRYFLHRVFRN